jgi:acyl dehydratase
MKEQYFEDYAAGQTFLSGKHQIDKDQIIAFAKQFDPQFYHLDEEAAKNSPFKGLAASGWHTAAITMRAHGRRRIQAGWRHYRRRLR